MRPLDGISWNECWAVEHGAPLLMERPDGPERSAAAAAVAAAASVGGRQRDCAATIADGCCGRARGGPAADRSRGAEAWAGIIGASAQVSGASAGALHYDAAGVLRWPRTAWSAAEGRPLPSSWKRASYFKVVACSDTHYLGKSQTARASRSAVPSAVQRCARAAAAARRAPVAYIRVADARGGAQRALAERIAPPRSAARAAPLLPVRRWRRDATPRAATLARLRRPSLLPCAHAGRGARARRRPPRSLPPAAAQRRPTACQPRRRPNHQHQRPVRSRPPWRFVK